jgi:transcriptional regulator with XRE-family HTH domain
VNDNRGTFRTTLRALGARARAARILHELTQQELAARAGVGISTLQRFENTGSATIENVLRIATALRGEQAFEALFAPPAYQSLDQALASSRGAAVRRRVRKRRLR